MTVTTPPAPDEENAGRGPALVRSLGAWDGALITIGATVGTGIFLTTGDIARRLPQPGLILLLWAAGGLYAMAGAMAYSELGAMFPRAGGQYHFLKEAYGPLWGFLFGWTSFLVIMTGGIAAIAVGFGEYLGGFVPVFSADSEILSLGFGAHRWTVQGPQLAGALAIVLLTGVNWLGVREGAMVQNAATVLKVAALAALAAIGLGVPLASAPAWWAPLPPGSLGPGLGLGMVAVLWTYDGWYVLTFSAGEMRRPERNLPRGLVGGVAVVAALYLAINWVYVRALGPAELGRASRVGESAAVALLGPGAARAVAVVILLSMFGCLAANVLCCARIYLPMAQDGVFFRSLARVDPRHHTPSTSLLAQGALAAVLALSGTYAELYTTVVFAGVLFHAATAAAVFVLRRKRPGVPRPYRAWGHPWLTGTFVVGCLGLALVSLVQAPVRSLLGLGLIASGLPAYAWWSRRATDQAPGRSSVSSSRA
ncbi:MAG: APC family permease [Myxococcaceae bacterium]